MSSIRKPCINFPTCTYTGKEQSPLKFGLSAEGYDLYTTMEGFDKLSWTVVIKNSRKVWIRKIVDNTLTHEEPVINSVNDLNITLEKTNTIIQEDNIDIDKNNTNVKKITDYNIFLSYRLKQLKEENKDNKFENKDLFNKAMDEWKKIKNTPQELKDFINKTKQDVAFNSSLVSDNSSKKKKKDDSAKISKKKNDVSNSLETVAKEITPEIESKVVTENVPNIIKKITSKSSKKDKDKIIKVDEVKVDEVKVDEVKVDEVKVDEVKVNEIKVDEVNEIKVTKPRKPYTKKNK